MEPKIEKNFGAGKLRKDIWGERERRRRGEMRGGGAENRRVTIDGNATQIIEDHSTQSRGSCKHAKINKLNSNLARLNIPHRKLLNSLKTSVHKSSHIYVKARFNHMLRNCKRNK